MSHESTGERNLSAMTDAWSAMTRGFIQSATAANRAMVSAMFPSSNGSCGEDPVPASIPSIEYSDLDWQFERTVDDVDALGAGDVVTFEKTLTEEDVRAFAHVSGDTNRLHLDEAFASESRFGQPIAHGTLVSGLISAALARLPGLTVYLSQDLEFRAPVAIGERVAARVEIVEDLGNDQYRLETTIRNVEDDEIAVQGEAVVLIDEMPDG